MSFLDGIGRAIHSPGFGLRLQAALAAARGDQNMRFHIQELQRQNALRDAQVMGAKNMGISNDEIGALSPQDLSHLAYDRAAQRMFAAPTADRADVDGDGMWKTDGMGQAGATGVPPAQASPDQPKPLFDDRGKGTPPLAYGAQAAFPQVGYGVATAGKALSRLLRASTPDEAAGLPAGSVFVAPNGSIRKKL